MSGYNYNLYTGGGIPDQGNNGLPLVIADANLPTQGVAQKSLYSKDNTALNYSAHAVESGLLTPATTHVDRAVQYSRVAASGEPSSQKFIPTPQPAAPSLWRTVVNAVVGGKIKTGSAYAAQGDYSTQGNGLGGIAGPSNVGNGRMQTGGSGGIVTQGSSSR